MPKAAAIGCLRESSRLSPPSARRTVKALRRVLSFLDAVTRRRLMLAVAFSAVLAPIELVGVGLVLPLLELFSNNEVPADGLTARLSDWTGISDAQDLAVVLGIAVVALFVLRSAGTLLVRWWTLKLMFDAERRVASRLLRGYLREPYARHLQRNSAEVLNTLQLSVDQTFGGYVAGALSLAAEALVGISILGLLIVVQPLPTVILGAYFALVAPLYLRTIHRRAFGAGDRLLTLSREAILVARDALDGIKELTVLERSEEFTRRFDLVRVETARARQTMQFLREAPRFMIEIVFLLGVIVLVVVLSLLGSTEDLLPTLGVFVAAGFRLMPPIGRFVSAQSSMRAALPSLNETCNELERLEGLRPVDHQRVAARAPHDLTFETSLTMDRVTFRHEGAARPSLIDVSVAIRPLESVAVVGSSGAGKTTFVDLILGLLEPTEGRICVDDNDISSCLAGWRGVIGYVAQDVFLVDASLRENVALGIPAEDIDDDAVLRAVEGAQLAGLVDSLPSGIHGKIGERGVRISGGQRQRIGIARALYNEPRLLVLDEATSALDGETEARITETISMLRERVTVIAIAHRLSTLKDFERVLFFSNGRLEADGSFEQLERENREFARLLRQARLDLAAS